MVRLSGHLFGWSSDQNFQTAGSGLIRPRSLLSGLLSDYPPAVFLISGILGCTPHNVQESSVLYYSIGAYVRLNERWN